MTTCVLASQTSGSREARRGIFPQSSGAVEQQVTCKHKRRRRSESELEAMNHALLTTAEKRSARNAEQMTRTRILSYKSTMRENHFCSITFGHSRAGNMTS